MGRRAGSNLIHPDPWFSEALGRPAFRVEAEAAAARQAAAEGRPGSFYYAKVPSDRGDLLAAFGTAGFYAIDVNVSFVYEGPPVGAAPAGVEIGEAEPADRDGVVEIAGTFVYTRFHLDPAIPNEVADRLKRAWVTSCLDGRRGVRVWVARASGRPVGFLTVVAGVRDGVPYRRIDLVGVAPEARGRGIGRALARTFLAEEGKEAPRLEVGTQVANIPSIRLYESLGFRLFAAEHVLHRNT